MCFSLCVPLCYIVSQGFANPHKGKKGEVKDIMERTVRNAAKALIIKDDKMLAIKISDGKEEWYIMPGGGQDVEELLPETVCREVAEEMGLADKVRQYGWRSLTAKESGRIGGLMTKKRREMKQDKKG